MDLITLVFLLNVLVISSATEYARKYGSSIDRLIFNCRSTDFTCFQRQFRYIRDIAVFGSQELEVPAYQHYQFQYSDSNTCVLLSGAESSQLVGISFNGITRMFSMIVAMPVDLEQVTANSTMSCQKPEKDFTPVGPHQGPHKKFSCNATLLIHFPFSMHKEEGGVYMTIDDDDLDVTLDIPDLSSYNKNSALETRMFRWSEWAYEVVQHVNVADHVIVPFMLRLKVIFTKLPLNKFILLYPTESYSDLVFKFSEDKAKNWSTE